MLPTAEIKQYQARKLRIKQAKQAIMIFGVILLIILQFYGFSTFTFSVDVNTNNHQRQTLSLSELYKDETPEYQQQIKIIKELEAYYTQYQEMILLQNRQALTLQKDNRIQSGGHPDAPFGIGDINPKSREYYNNFVEDMRDNVFSIINRINLQQSGTTAHGNETLLDQAIINALTPWKSDLFAAESFISRIKENLIFENKEKFWYLKYIHRVAFRQYGLFGQIHTHTDWMYYGIQDRTYVDDIQVEIRDTDVFNDYFPKTVSNDNNMNQILSILHELEGNFNEYILFLWSIQFAFPEYEALKEGDIKKWKEIGNSQGFYQTIGKYSIGGRMKKLLKYIREIEGITNSSNVAMTQIQEWQNARNDESIIYREQRLQYQLPRTRQIIRSVVDNAMSDLAIYIQSNNPNLYHKIQKFRENTLQLDINKDLLILDDLFTAFENLSNVLDNLFKDAWTQAKLKAKREWQQYRGDSPLKLVRKELGIAFGRTANNSDATLFEFTYPMKLHELLKIRMEHFEDIYNKLRHEMAKVMEQIILRYHGKLNWMINFKYTPKVQYNVMKGGKVEKDIGSSVSESFLQFWFRVNRMITDDKAMDIEALTTIFKPFILDIVFQISPETARVYGKQFGKLLSPTMEHIPEVECTKYDPIGCIDRFFQLVPKYWLLLNELVIHANQALLYPGIIPPNKVSMAIDAWGWLHMQYITAAMIGDIRIWFHLDLDDALIELADRYQHRFKYFADLISPVEMICVPYRYRLSRSGYKLFRRQRGVNETFHFLEPLKEDKDIFDAEKLNIQSLNEQVKAIRERMSNDNVSIAS